MKETNLKSLQYQTGATFWSMCFVLAVLGLFAYVGMQLVPIYNVNSNVKNAMKLTLDDSEIDLKTATRSQIEDRMDKQLYLDGSHNVLNYKNDVKIRRSDKKFMLETNYTRIVPLFFNLSLMAEFNNVVERDLN